MREELRALSRSAHPTSAQVRPAPGRARPSTPQVTCAAILTEASVMGEAFDEQRAFRREHASGAYSIVAYHLQWASNANN